MSKPTSQTTLLQARGLHKKFGAVVAANDICIDIPNGQRVSVIGSNGAGKTTFVNMVTGYLRPDAGQILLDGRDIAGLPPQQVVRRGISRSFQIPQLCTEISLWENLLVAVNAASERGLSFWRPAQDGPQQERTVELMERFELQDYADRPIRELPGGVRKLLDIAMAMARRPRLLLLDEPTSGVSGDQKSQTMQQVISALGRDEVTVLFIEHDMDLVEEFSERVIAFYSGQVIGDGTPAEVLRSTEVRRYITGAA